jgi:hypothetical protein
MNVPLREEEGYFSYSLRVGGKLCFTYISIRLLPLLRVGVRTLPPDLIWDSYQGWNLGNSIVGHPVHIQLSYNKFLMNGALVGVQSHNLNTIRFTLDQLWHLFIINKQITHIWHSYFLCIIQGRPLWFSFFLYKSIYVIFWFQFHIHIIELFVNCIKRMKLLFIRGPIRVEMLGEL